MYTYKYIDVLYLKCLNKLDLTPNKITKSQLVDIVKYFLSS